MSSVKTTEVIHIKNEKNEKKEIGTQEIVKNHTIKKSRLNIKNIAFSALLALYIIGSMTGLGFAMKILAKQDGY